MLNVCIFPKCWVFSFFCSSKFPRTMTKCDSFHLNTYYICQEKKHSSENLLYFSSKTYNYILCHQQHQPNLKRQWYSGSVEEFKWNPPKIKLKFRFLIHSFFWQSNEMLPSVQIFNESNRLEVLYLCFILLTVFLSSWEFNAMYLLGRSEYIFYKRGLLRQCQCCASRECSVSASERWWESM